MRNSTRPPAINIVAGETFTIAKVGDRTVAVSWGEATGGPYFVSDGQGSPRQEDTEGQAASTLLGMAIAASSGSASSVTRPNTGDRDA